MIMLNQRKQLWLHASLKREMSVQASSDGCGWWKISLAHMVLSELSADGFVVPC